MRRRRRARRARASAARAPPPTLPRWRRRGWRGEGAWGSAQLRLCCRHGVANRLPWRAASRSALCRPACKVPAAAYSAWPRITPPARAAPLPPPRSAKWKGKGKKKKGKGRSGDDDLYGLLGLQHEVGPWFLFPAGCHSLVAALPAAAVSALLPQFAAAAAATLLPLAGCAAAAALLSLRYWPAGTAECCCLERLLQCTGAPTHTPALPLSPACSAGWPRSRRSRPRTARPRCCTTPTSRWGGCGEFDGDLVPAAALPLSLRRMCKPASRSSRWGRHQQAVCSSRRVIVPLRRRPTWTRRARRRRKTSSKRCRTRTRRSATPPRCGFTGARGGRGGARGAAGAPALAVRCCCLQRGLWLARRMPS